MSLWIFYDNTLDGPRVSPFDNNLFREFGADPNAANPSLGPEASYMYVPVVDLGGPSEFNPILARVEVPQSDLVDGSGSIAGAYEPISQPFPYGRWVRQPVLSPYTEDDMATVRQIAEASIDTKLAEKQQTPFVDTLGREYPFTFVSVQARNAKLAVNDRVQSETPGPPTQTQLTEFDDKNKVLRVVSVAQESASVAAHANAIGLADGLVNQAKADVYAATTPQQAAAVVGALDLTGI